MKNTKLTSLFLIILLALPFIGCDKILSEVKVLEENDKGIKAINSGDSEGSLVHFHNAINLNPKDQETKSTIYRNIALAHSDLLNDDSAVVYHKLAANCYKPGEYFYLINMADADLFNENIGSAESRLLKAQALNPNEVGANNSLGLIYLGEYDDEHYDLNKALIYNKKAFEINGDRITEQVLAQTYISLDNHDKALLHLTSVHSQYPGVLDEMLEFAKLDLMYESDLDYSLTFQLIEEVDPTKKEEIEELKADFEI